MSRYLSDYNCRHEQYIIEFPDEYSEWCDYFIKNSVEYYLNELTEKEADAEAASTNAYYRVERPVFPAAAFQIHLSDHARGRARTMLDSLVSGGSSFVFASAVEDGVRPKEMYEIKRFSDQVDGHFGGYNYILNYFDIADIRTLAANPDRFISLFSGWRGAEQWLKDNPDAAMDLYYLPDQYDAMLAQASDDDDLTLDDIMNWIDNMNEAYNSWVDGVPVHDVFV